MSSLLALVLMFGLMWALLIRPQQRRVRVHQAVVASLRAGDEVITAGGMYGTILSVDDDSMILEVAPGVEIRVLRAAVSQKVAEDEDEAADEVLEEADGVPELAEPSRDEEA